MSIKLFPGYMRAMLAHWGGDLWAVLLAFVTFKVEIVTLRGQMRGSEDDLTLLYVGRGRNLSHFTKKYFVEAETVQSIKTNVLAYHKAMAAAERDADVVFVDVGRPYISRIRKTGAYLELPDWIKMVVPLEETWDATVQNFRKTMRKNIGRLIRKNNYRSVPTNDPAIVNSFYAEFYEPFIKSRHSDETVLTPRAIVKQCARTGTILQVVDDEGTVAAGVYFTAGGNLHLLVTGMPEQYLDNPPIAAMQALYFFSMQYAFENGLKSIDFMGTRAFPTDGLFQFKRKWGAGALDEFSDDSIFFKPGNTAMAAQFCELFPMIARKDGSLQLLVCARSDAFGEAECAKMLSDYHCSGLEDVKVVHLSDQGTGSPEAVSAGGVGVRVKRSDLAHFAESYVEG